MFNLLAPLERLLNSYIPGMSPELLEAAWRVATPAVAQLADDTLFFLDVGIGWVGFYTEAEDF